MKTLTLKIDESLHHWLESEARQVGRTKSELAREALQQWRKGKLGPSLHDLMKDVCGIIKTGPRDLATNKKYLKDLGRDSLG